MKRIWIAAVLALTMILSGCVGTAVPGVGAVNLMADIKANEVSPGDTAADTTAFAVSLLKNTYTGENTVVSPVSAYLALAMTANGAGGVTLREFEQVLGAKLEALNDTGKLLLDAMSEASGGVTLKSVDGIWYNTNSDFEPNGDFLQINADYFGAAAVASDFSKKSTVDGINGFIRENTNGLIEKMLETLGDDAVMVLVNTLYFKGTWQEPFILNYTHDATFTLSGGKEIKTPTMVQEYGAVSYFESDGARGVILPYVGGRYAYAAILPDGGVSEYVAALTGADFTGLLQSASEQNIALYLPKYEVKGSYELGDILKNMGLQMAFDPEKADFSAMGTASMNLFISRVLQDTVFKLGEEGTEAAAATVVVGDGCAETQPLELRLDRPFVYALMDMETMTPLFMGVVENPAG